MKPIQIFQPFFRVDECLSEIKQCLDKGWTGIGFKTIEFEEQWKKYTLLSNAHFVNSATAGLHLAVRILKDEYHWRKGDEIITTPFTFVSTNHAILYENLKPVFADIDESLNLSPSSVESKIGPKTRAIMFVGIGGSVDNLHEIITLGRRYGLKVILDAAHMAGAQLHDRHVGLDTDVSVFSYHAVKNCPTADSGMVCFADPECDKLARTLSWMGINKDTYSRVSPDSYKWRYDVDQVGYKYHGNSIIAAIGLVSLRYLDQDNAYRRKLAQWYKDILEGMDGVRIIDHKMPLSSRHLFQILVEDRDKIIEQLNKQHIYPGVHYRMNTDYTPYDYAAHECPQARYYSERVLSLPLHCDLSKKEIDYIVSSLAESIKAQEGLRP